MHGETTGSIGSGNISCRTNAGVSLLYNPITKTYTKVHYSAALDASYLNIFLKCLYVSSTAVNCSTSDLPDLSNRTDVVTTDWDNVTTSFGTVVK